MLVQGAQAHMNTYICIKLCETNTHPYPKNSGDLAHFPLDKKAAILADDIFKWSFLDGNGRISIQISLKFVPKSPIDNTPANVDSVYRRI